MTSPKLVIDVAAGTRTYARLTPEEEADRAERQAEHAAAVAREAAYARALADRAPGAALLGKVRNGQPLDAGELGRLVGWLALRAIGPA